MKMHHDFKATRRVASHCVELLNRGTEKRAPSEYFDSISATIANKMANAFGAICGTPPNVSHGTAETVSFAQLTNKMDGQFSHAVIMIGPQAVPVLASFESSAAFLLLDQAFGGSGTIPECLPKPLPASATIMISQIQMMINRTLSLAFNCPPEQTSLRAMPSKFSPFAPRAALTTAQFSLCSEGGREWHIRLAMDQDKIGDLPGKGTSIDAEVGSETQTSRAYSPFSAPFSSIPLGLRAVLVDAEISLAKVSRLKRGQVLPVSVSRNVPLWADDVEIGRGSIGSLDDNVAIKINKINNHQRISK